MKERNVPASKWGGSHCSHRIRLQKSEGERLAVNPSVLGSILWREPEYDISGQISVAPTTGPTIETSVPT